MLQRIVEGNIAEMAFLKPNRSVDLVIENDKNGITKLSGGRDKFITLGISLYRVMWTIVEVTLGI